MLFALPKTLDLTPYTLGLRPQAAAEPPSILTARQKPGATCFLNTLDTRPHRKQSILLVVATTLHS